MPFNYPFDGTKPPFANGYMTLTHEEVMYVKTTCEQIIADYLPEYDNGNPIPTLDYVVSTYNNVDAWQKAINGENYNLINSYDPLVHLLGIDSTGIIQPPVEETGEE